MLKNLVYAYDIGFVIVGCEFWQEITGVFMKNCMLHYPMYRDIYPMWALAEYRRRVSLPSAGVE